MELVEKEIVISSELSQLLPNVKISPLRLGSSNGVQAVHYFISPHNHDLLNSEYYYDGELQFVHFTKLSSIQSILSEKHIRLYNLNNLSDPREYSYAGKLNLFNSKIRLNAKENIYILSMCKEQVLRDKNIGFEFNLWRLYGDNGFGVAVILGFSQNKPSNWKDYFLSKIHYGASSREKLVRINDLIKKYEKESPGISIDLGQLVCFHKSNLYSLEEEIRLLFDNREKNILSATQYRNSKNELVSPIIKDDIVKSVSSSKKIKYLELPIFYNSYDTVSEDNKVPIPKIESIILGYQYKKPYSVIGKLQSLCLKQLGYLPQIIPSRLVKYYHDK
jgi:hypothetical protein